MGVSLPRYFLLGLVFFFGLFLFTHSGEQGPARNLLVFGMSDFLVRPPSEGGAHLLNTCTSSDSAVRKGLLVSSHALYECLVPGMVRCDIIPGLGLAGSQAPFLELPARRPSNQKVQHAGSGYAGFPFLAFLFLLFLLLPFFFFFLLSFIFSVISCFCWAVQFQRHYGSS
eukprot:RCo002522